MEVLAQQLPLDVLHDDEVEVALAPQLIYLGDVAVGDGGCEPRAS
jgi:hypothetical protein